MKILEGGQDVSYYLKIGYNGSGKEFQWPEMFVTDYIERSIELNELFLYEFVMKYDVFYYRKAKKWMGNKAEKY